MSAQFFYLQDNRSYVGNDLLFWAEGGRGYTTDVSKAAVYTKEAVIAQNNCRETDIPWPKDYIDVRTRPAVDMQYVDINVALKDTGIKLIKPGEQKRIKQTCSCSHCGLFMSEYNKYVGNRCTRCGYSGGRG